MSLEIRDAKIVDCRSLGLIHSESWKAAYKGIVQDSILDNMSAEKSEKRFYGNKVGIMGGGTTVDGKGDINKLVGIMGSGDAPANSDPAPGTKKYIDGVLHVWVPGLKSCLPTEPSMATNRERRSRRRAGLGRQIQ